MNIATCVNSTQNPTASVATTGDFAVVALRRTRPVVQPTGRVRQLLLRRQPCPQRCRGGQVHDREHDERRLPARARGDEARGRPSAEAANHRAADVRRGGASRVRRRPTFVDVGDGDREHPGRQDPVNEPPGDQLGKRRRRRGKRGRDRQQNRRSNDDPLATNDVRERPTNGAASATAMVDAVTVRLTAKGGAWKTRISSGSSGCVAYRSRKAVNPARTTGQTGGGTN